MGLKKRIQTIYSYIKEKKSSKYILIGGILGILLFGINIIFIYTDSKDEQNKGSIKVSSTKKPDNVPPKTVGDITIQDYSQKEKESILKSSVVDTTIEKYTYDSMVEDINILCSLYPDKVEGNIIGTTICDRNIYDLIIGNKNAKKHILIHGGIHAREYMTSQLLMKQVEWYLKNYANIQYQNINSKDMFNDVAFHIVPMVNPDGISLSQLGLSSVKDTTIRSRLQTNYKNDFAAKKVYCDMKEYFSIWKANIRGVDINRNFAQGWYDYEGSNTPSRLTYKGSAPESESETKALVKLVDTYPIKASLAYHTAGSVIYWDFHQTGLLREKCYQIVTMIHTMSDYIIYNATDKELQTAGYSDWMVLTNKIPTATVEIGTGLSPVTANQFPTVWKDNKDVWMGLGKIVLDDFSAAQDK